MPKRIVNFNCSGQEILCEKTNKNGHGERYKWYAILTAPTYIDEPRDQTSDILVENW